MDKTNVKFEMLEDPEDFTRLKEGWESLCDLLEDRITVFSTFLWHQGWWRFYGTDARMHLFAMWHDDQLTGVAPLMWKKMTLHGLPVGTVGFMQNNQSLHNDFIVVPRYRELFLEHLLQALFERSSQWDVLYFRNISPASDNCRSLVDIVEAQGRPWKLRSNPIDSPYLAPEGSWADFLAGRTGRARKSLRNIRNRIHGAGEVLLRNIRTREEFLACKEDLFEVARQSWTEKVGDSLASPLNREFFESLAFAAAEKGWLSIWVLYLNGRAIAVEFHLRAYGREHALRGHYHPEFASLSPGAYLEMAILEQVFDGPERVRIYDFCGAFDDYKKKWTDASVPHCDVHVFKDHVYSRLAMVHEFKIVPCLRRAIRFVQAMSSGNPSA